MGDLGLLGDVRECAGREHSSLRLASKYGDSCFPPFLECAASHFTGKFDTAMH